MLGQSDGFVPKLSRAAMFFLPKLTDGQPCVSPCILKVWGSIAFIIGQVGEASDDIRRYFTKYCHAAMLSDHIMERFFVGMAIVGFVGLFLTIGLSVYPHCPSSCHANSAAPLSVNFR
jgi:hypothetical protein